MRVLLLITFNILIVTLPKLMAQCAMCRATLENNVSNGEAGIASGINVGIMYLFFIPYIAIGAAVFFWYKSCKKREHT